MAKLVVISEGFTGKTVELSTEKVTIGRLGDNTFQIEQGSISGHHCEVVLKDKQIHVKDLGSTNGTFLNNKQITEGTLNPGQILRLGSIEMRFEGEKGAEPAVSKTIALPQAGVKLDDLEKGTQAVSFEKGKGFAKKSNKVNKIFITVGVIAALVVIASVIYAVMQLKGE